MSLPTFSTVKITREQAINQIITSIAMEEAAVARILANVKPCVSSQPLIDSLVDLTIILKNKLKLALQMKEEPCPPIPPIPPIPPCPPPIPPKPTTEIFQVRQGCIPPRDSLRFNRPIILRRGETEIHLKLILSAPARFLVLIESCGRIVESITIDKPKTIIAVSLKTDALMKIKLLGDNSIRVLEGEVKICESSCR